MAESTDNWFIIREKYCSLTKKVRLISQANRAICWFLSRRVSVGTYEVILYTVFVSQSKWWFPLWNVLVYLKFAVHMFLQGPCTWSSIISGAVHGFLFCHRNMMGGVCSCSLFVWLWLVVNDRKFPARTVFFSHTKPASSNNPRSYTIVSAPAEQVDRSKSVQALAYIHLHWYRANYEEEKTGREKWWRC